MDNLGGVLSVVLVGTLILAINFAPVPNKGSSHSAWPRSRPLRSSRSSSASVGRRIFWVAACAGIIVFGSLMGSAFVSQQYLQNVLGSRAGMASGTADLQRDLGGAIMQSIFGALLTAGYAAVGPVVPDHLAAVILDHRFTGCDATPPGVLEM